MTKADKKAQRAARKGRPPFKTPAPENKVLAVPENKGHVAHRLMHDTWLDRVKRCIGIR